jgi:hypothetical protein
LNRRYQNQLPHHRRVPDDGLLGDATAKRVAHDIGTCETEIFDQRADVVGHRLETQRAVNVGRAAMGLQIYGDDLPALG